MLELAIRSGARQTAHEGGVGFLIQNKAAAAHAADIGPKRVSSGSSSGSTSGASGQHDGWGRGESREGTNQEKR